MSTFVTVGNGTQQFTRLLNAIKENISKLPPPVAIQYGNNSFTSPVGVSSAVPFLSMDEFTANVRAAELVIAHAGAGTIIHALLANKVPVVMAREAQHHEIADDHQVELVRMLVGTGKIVACHNAEELPSAVRLAQLQQETISRGTPCVPPLVAAVEELLNRYADKKRIS